MKQTIARITMPTVQR